MLSLLNRFLSPYVVLGLMIALVLALGAATLEHHRAKRFQAEADRYKDANTQLLAAVDGKDKTIAEQRELLDRWRTWAEQYRARLQAAVDEAARSDDRLTQTVRQLNQLRDKDHARPDCNAILNLDLGAVCPDTVRWLRERAADRLSGASGTSAGPGTDPG